MASARDEYDYGALWRSTMTNEEFAECARRPEEWINVARPLRVSAYVLKSQTSRWDIARAKGEAETSSVGLLFTSLFLASLSLENVLKAVLLVRRPALADDGRLRFENWGHDLVRIASEAGFQQAPEEGDFLRVSCNPCIVSFGRYPVAVSKNNAPASWQFHTGAFRYFEASSCVRWKRHFERAATVRTPAASRSWTGWPPRSRRTFRHPPCSVRWQRRRRRPSSTAAQPITLTDASAQPCRTRSIAARHLCSLE